MVKVGGGKERMRGREGRRKDGHPMGESEENDTAVCRTVAPGLNGCPQNHNKSVVL